jgi:transposase
MVLTDEQRAALKSALDAVRPGTGRPLAGERRAVEGVVWRLRNGARRRAVPAEFGPWWRAAQLHIRWSATGLCSGSGCSRACATRAGSSWPTCSWTAR